MLRFRRRLEAQSARPFRQILAQFLVAHALEFAGFAMLGALNANAGQYRNLFECPSSDDLRLVRRFAKRGSGSSGVRLGGLQPVLQATVCNSLTLDTLTLSQDCLGSAEVDVSRREVVDALMVANVIVVLDEGGDLSFEVVG